MKPVSLPLGRTALGRGGRGSIEEAFLFNEISLRKTPAPSPGSRSHLLMWGTASEKALLLRRSQVRWCHWDD